MAFGTPTYATTAPTGALGMNEAVGLLKEYYGKQPVKIMAYKKSPVLAMMRKEQMFTGKYYPQPVITESANGASASFTTAQANQVPFTTSEFIITRTKLYQVATIDRETMLAASNDQGAFLRTATQLVDSAVAALAQDISVNLFRDGTGYLGTFAVGGISTGVITLDDPNAVTGFRRGDVLEARATNGGTQSTGNNLGYVFAINRTLGTITVATSLANAAAGTAGTPTNWSTSFPVLNRQGNNNAVAMGFQGYLPATAPSGSDNFFSVNRSIDSRLYGSNYNGSNQSIEEAIIDAAAILDQEGGTPDVCILSTRGYAALEKAMVGRTVYDTWEDKELGISFRGLVLNTPSGTVRVFSDRYCPGKTGWLLTMSTWCLISLLEVPHIVDEDNDQRMLRITNADAYELRVSALYNVACDAPGWNAQLTLVA